jgi:hypothetical protein
MTTAFVNTLRARRQGVRIGAAGVPTVTVRVEIPEQWDVVRVEVPPTETVLAVKVAALAALNPRSDQRHYVMKLRGFEMLDEQQSVTDAGAIEGSTFLLTHRRRRPVR